MKLSDIVTLDFETFYDVGYSLQAMSTSEYIRSDKFEVSMMGLKIGDGPTEVIEANEIPARLSVIDWSECGMLAHNAAFDGFILSQIYDTKPLRYFDTFSMARGLHSNDIGAGLDEVARHYGLDGKVPGILTKTKGEHIDYKHDLWHPMMEYCRRDVDLTWAIFKLMLKEFPPQELRLINLTIRMFCDPVLRVDVPRAQAEYEREVKEAEDTLRAVNPDVEEARRIIGSNQFADLLRAEGAEPPTKISPAWLKKPVEERDDAKKLAYAFAKDDEGMLDLLSDVRPKVRALAEARLAVKSTGNVNKAKRFLEAVQGGAALPVGLSYYRAHTGRFGGSNRMNLQNMERGGELRQCILAPEGMQIFVCDSAQIEARVNAWLWGQMDLLESFAANRDVYSEFASTVYGREITKDDKTERFVGKTAVLGLGFGMGAVKFKDTLAKAGIILDEQQCKIVIKKYRAKHKPIVNGWAVCTNIIRDMIEGKHGSYKCLSWGKEHILLPNGMKLKYPGLTVVGGEYAYFPKGKQKKLYGGLLCENIVQALARIIVCDQMLEIDKFAKVVFFVHDEVVAVSAEDVMDRMLAEMKSPPLWAEDLPLNSEGGAAANYSK